MTKYMVNYNILYCSIDNPKEPAYLLPSTFHKVVERDCLSFEELDSIQHELIKYHESSDGIHCPMIVSLYSI